MSRDLKILENTYNNSEWLQNHDHEPLVGDLDCPALAQEYGISRVSCYSVFLEEINATYLCRFERCRGFAPSSLEDALRHQRYNHFDHRPFLCAPDNGKQWQVYINWQLLLSHAKVLHSNRRFYAQGDLISHQKNCSSSSS